MKQFQSDFISFIVPAIGDVEADLIYYMKCIFLDCLQNSQGLNLDEAALKNIFNQITQLKVLEGVESF